MAHVGPAVKRFLDAQMAAFEALILKSITDGVEHFSEDYGQKVTPDPEFVQRARQRLHGFYMPSLIRIHNQLLSLVATATDAQEVDRWLKSNEYRIESAITGMLWSGAEAGYAAAASSVDDVGGIFWNVDNSVDHHCGMCPVFASGSPYRSFLELPAWPGDGTTPCGGNCYCYLTVGKAAPDA